MASGACSAQIPVLAEIHAAAAAVGSASVKLPIYCDALGSSPPAGWLEARLRSTATRTGVVEYQEVACTDSGVGEIHAVVAGGSASVKIPIYRRARSRGNIGSGSARIPVLSRDPRCWE